MSSIIDRLFTLIQRGRDGKNQGLSIGIPTLDKSLYGLQRKYCVLIGADSGSGKSSFTLYSYIFRPLMDNIDKTDKDIWILYLSFELSAEVIMAKLMSMYIHEAFGVIITYEDVLSLRRPLTEEGFQYIIAAKEWMDKCEEHIAIIDKPLTPDQIGVTIRRFTEQFGHYETISDTEEIYHPNNPEQYIITVIDHLGLIDSNPVKMGIDQTVKHFIYYRNIASITGVLIQQLNRNFKAVDRKLNGMEMVQLNDFADSSGPVQGCEAVIAIYDPYREKQRQCKGYNIEELKDRAKILQVLKHRFGKSNFIVGVSFFGECNQWLEMPKPNLINDYTPYKRPEGEYLRYPDNEEVIDNNCNTDNLNFSNFKIN